MPTKATLKLVKSLQQKKYRKEHGLFVVEGYKSVQEFVNSQFQLKHLFILESEAHLFPKAEICTTQEMQQLSGMRTAPGVLGVFEQANWSVPTNLSGLSIALDNLQDPGNLGTIIRLADWFGIQNIFCTKSTVDVYNPKVIQACMGSLTRVRIHYLDLKEFIETQNIPIVGTFMDGSNLYKASLPTPAVVVLGNEANGISGQIETLCSHRIAIPQAGNSTESLNVAMATGITLSEFYRQENYV